MNLSNELVSLFVKSTKDQAKTPKESTVYGTVVQYGDSKYVQLDGSDQLTPCASVADVAVGERVSVQIKNHTATITGNLSSPSAKNSTVQGMGDAIDGNVAYKITATDIESVTATIQKLEAILIDCGELNADEINAVLANIETLKAQYIEGKYITTEELKAITAEIDSLYATFGSFSNLSTEHLEAVTAEINQLKVYSGDFTYLMAEEFEAINASIKNLNVENLDAKYAKIEQLEAEKARINVLETTTLTADSAEIKNLQADVADIDTLIFGSASGESIQTSFANAVIAQLGNAQIKSAMIDTVNASQINAGDINTNSVRVVSEDGKLVISDETIQISDSTRVRVQIGKDASDDYSINIWDADGNLMFSEGGITDNAIKDAIIRNDMVSDDANISASKLDISSLFTEINDSSETIDSSKILLDADNQTLDVAFTQMKSTVTDQGETVESHGTQITAIQGQITSKIWQQDIENATDGFGDSIETLNTQYSSLEQTVDGISTTVASHTTQIGQKADGSTVTEVSGRVSKVEADLTSFRTEVSDTYATKDALSSSITEVNTAIEQTKDSIDLKASKTEVDDVKSDLADNYYTKAGVQEYTYSKTDTDAKIKVNSDAILLSATKQELNEQIKTVNDAVEDAQGTADTALSNAATAQGTADSVKDNLANNYYNKTAAESYVQNYTYSKTDTDAKIKVNSDAILLSATKEELTTVSELANEAKGIADGVKTDLSDNYYKKTETYTKTEANQQIDAAKGEIKTTVEQTYATKTALTNVEDKADAAQENIDDFTDYVEETYAAKTELSQTAEGIRLHVQETYTSKDEFNSLKVGARNLIRTSTDLSFENYYFSGAFIAQYDGVSDIAVICGASAVSDGTGNVTLLGSAKASHSNDNVTIV